MNQCNNANRDTVLKVIGADFELGNSIIAGGVHRHPPRKAATMLLAEIERYPLAHRGGTRIESDRGFLPTSGSSFYLDSDHCESNLPEHCCALDHPKVLHGAGLSVVRRAQLAASRRLTAGKLNVFANCSDGNTAWGSHLNILVTRRCFDRLHYHSPCRAAFFATHLVSSVLYTGQGLVGGANGRNDSCFQLSQRADWFETFASHDTMIRRPLINLRDESHASGHLAREHVIYLDMVLSGVANILKSGTVQLVLAMLEQGWFDSTICLDNPVRAASIISRDLNLRQRLPTAVRSRSMTALEIQQALAELAGEFVSSGHAKGIVPEAHRIVELWTQTLEMLKQRDVDALARRCDNWLKFLLLDRQRGRKNLNWGSADLKVADALFASLDPNESLFFQAAADGFVEQMPDAASIERYRCQPPDDTRAFFRAHVLRRFGASVQSMNWDRITFQVPHRNWWFATTIAMPDPLALTRSETEQMFVDCTTLEDLVDAVHQRAPTTTRSMDLSLNPTSIEENNYGT